MKFICSSCGAKIDDSMPKCPYCDTMIAKGAEAEYMEKLYDIREDMEELSEIPMETVKTEVKSQGKRIRKIMGITATIILILAAVFFWRKNNMNVIILQIISGAGELPEDV